MDRWIHFLLAIVFFLFGMMQINDPDFWIWTPLYWVVAAVPLLYFRNMLSQMLLRLLMLLYSFYLISYIPDTIDWINGGMDNIAGSMKAEEPHIELAREFFGLVICLLALIYYHVKNKSKTL